jgi:predicted NBD/HSP70 family sugar kinase
MPLNANGAACHCGSVGCWETEVGADSLLRRAGRSPEGGRAAVDAVLAGASAGSPVDLAALEETGRWLAFGLAGLVNILNPRLVVMGGQFARILPFVEEVVKAGLDRYALSAPRRLVRVVPATLGADAPLLGAAEHAFEPLLADPAGWVRPRAGLTELASA